MSYEQLEESTAQGMPVECYLFSDGVTLWCYTSADRPITLPSGTYEPAIVSRGERAYSGEDGSGGLDVHLARFDPVVAPFVRFLPQAPLGLVIYRAHRGAEYDPRPIFTGTVRQVAFKDSEVTLTCVPVTRHFERNFPRLSFGRTCNWAVYSTSCGVDPDAFKVTAPVDNVIGLDLVIDALISVPSGTYDGGWVQRANGERRYIVRQVTRVITLMSPFSDLQPPEIVTLHPGCAGSEEVCSGTFDNLPRHLGFSTIPTRNPHRGRIG
jgi:hypothetical protein